MKEIYLWIIMTEIGCVGVILFVGIETILERLNIIIDERRQTSKLKGEGDSR